MAIFFSDVFLDYVRLGMAGKIVVVTRTGRSRTQQLHNGKVNYYSLPCAKRTASALHVVADRGAANEALSFGAGGVRALTEALPMSAKTILQGKLWVVANAGQFLVLNCS